MIVKELTEKYGTRGDNHVIIENDKKSYQSQMSGGYHCPINNHLKIIRYNEITIDRGIFKKVEFSNSQNPFKALIAHECSHIFHKDTISLAILKIIGLISTLIFFVLVIVFSLGFIVFFFIIFYIIISLRLINNIKRQMEIRCDKEAAKITKEIGRASCRERV